MRDLLKRLERIKACIKDRSGLFTVHYKDGRKETVKAEEMIDLALEHYEEIERFEEHGPRQHNGMLEELCNGLLEKDLFEKDGD